MLQVFEQLESVSSTKEKLKILNEQLTIEHCKLLNLVFDYKVKFYIKKLPKSTPKSIYTDQQAFDNFISITNSLSSRQITGNQARDAVEDFLSNCTELQHKWYSRILQKNLRCGVQLKLANKAIECKYSEYIIPEFNIQLCERENKFKENADITYYVEPKLDGVRVIYTSWEQKFYSRDGTEFHNFNLLIDEINNLQLTDKYKSGFVLDSEITYSGEGDPYEEIMKNLLVKDRETTTELEMTCFDILSKQEWESKSTAKLIDRREQLKQIFEDSNCKRLNIIDWQVFPMLYQEDITRLRNEACAEGYEGIIIKDIKSRYDFKRNNNWIKIKPFETLDVVVESLVEGTGKNIGKLGKFLFNFYGKEMGVGSGLTDEQREKFWNNPQEVIGKTIEIKFDKVTGTGGTRFPVFLRLRQDK